MVARACSLPTWSQAGASVTVLDASARLIAAARRRHAKLRGARFIEGDARRLPAVVGLERGAFDAAVFMLSIQDMDPLDDVVRGVDWALGPAEPRRAADDPPRLPPATPLGLGIRRELESSPIGASTAT